VYHLAAAVAFWNCFILTIQNTYLVWAIGLGFILGVMIDEYIIKKFPIIETFEHEFTHALAAILFLNKITKFKVTNNDGGYIYHRGGRRVNSK
jgi:hypothetical protein